MILRFYTLLLAAFAFWASSGEAAETGKAPVIVAHSKSQFTIHQGDRLDLQVDARGEKLSYRWMRSEEILCRTAKCEINTTSWGVGQQRLTLVVFNGIGSQAIRYFIKVLALPPEDSPKKVTPELLHEASSIEGLSDDDLTVRSLNGIGYAYQKAKVQVVGRLPRKLGWREKLRTHPTGSLRFGRPGTEEHTLLHESQIALFDTKAGRRGIQLIRGKLRSRQLDGKEPRWSIVLGDFAQVDGDEKADLIVEQSESMRGLYLVTVLRGFARIHQPQYDAKGNSVRGKILTVPRGTTVEIRKSAFPETFLKPDGVHVGELVAESSPEYLTGKKIDPALVDAKASKGAAAAAIAKEDFILALEILLQEDTKEKPDPDFALLLGKAYAGVYLYKNAEKHLTAALEKSANAAESHFQMGLIALDSEKWDDATSEFGDATDIAFNDHQLAYYYRGVGYYRQKKYLAAKNNFTQTLWFKKYPDVGASAQEFLDRIEKEKSFYLSLYLGAGKDSNVFRLGGDLVPPADIEATAGTFYRAGMDMYYEGFRDNGAFAGVSYGIDRFAYLSGELSEITKVDQHLGLSVGVALDEDTKNPYAQIVAKPTLGTTILGSDRVDDYIGTEVQLNMPAVVTQPRLLFNTMLHLDPLPGREDLYDPVIDEPQYLASERTKRWTEYGFSLYPDLDTNHRFGFDYVYAMMLYRSEELYVENFKGHEIRLRLHQPLSPRWLVQGSLQYKIRTFAESTDGRKDSFLALDTDLRWYWLPTYHLDLFATYQKNQSTRDESAYSRTVYGMLMGLDM